MTRAIALLLLTACGPDAAGTWTGQCETTDNALRVRLVVDERPDEESLQVPVRATLHLAERPADALSLECDELLVDGRDVNIGDCFGFWSMSGDPPGAFDFAIDGVMEPGEPTDTMGGRCTFEATEGALELVRTP